MYFTVDGEVRGVTNRSILDSVCRHVQGKDAVSHIFLWLSGYKLSSMQLVFSQGSLRLQSENQFDCVDTLHSFRRLFSRTEDIRVRYVSAGHRTDLVRSLASFLPATFPHLKVLSLIRQNRDIGVLSVDKNPTDHVLHWYLAELPRSASPPTPEADRVPHPTLDTLWVSVRSSEEIAPLEATLAARAALGFPIRCVIVHHFWSAGEEALARLRALDAQEVILTESRASDIVQLREVDWVVRLPEKFSLPAAIRRDWPTVWYRDQDDDEDDQEE